MAEPRIPPGLGYYANMVTSASVNRSEDLRPALGSVEAPVLVLRGVCDRMRREVAREYRDVFPDATLLVVEGAGRSTADARPLLYADVLRAFLVEEPLPLEPHLENGPSSQLVVLGI
jgi:proline iminopeptidase